MSKSGRTDQFEVCLGFFFVGFFFSPPSMSQHFHNFILDIYVKKLILEKKKGFLPTAWQHYSKSTSDFLLFRVTGR